MGTSENVPKSGRRNRVCVCVPGFFNFTMMNIIGEIYLIIPVTAERWELQKMDPNLDAETACVCVCACPAFFNFTVNNIIWGIYLIIPVTAKRWEPQKMDPNLDAETACVCVRARFFSQTMDIIEEHN